VASAVTPAIKHLKGYKISIKRDHVFRPILFHSGKLLFKIENFSFLDRNYVVNDYLSMK